ncbi:MAG: NHLP family bacteriocin export ABC transporter peptidase/permease/ATPase subunit [Lachnospiraceae bacterium]|nr:NHLP family bacteriocin export ABC transporter peptidase/permease/ATPase subunit [Lachnospiraceae bacterium]
MELNKNNGNKVINKVPVIMQMEALECGAASLAMILAFHGRWVPLEQLRSDCGVSRDGSNAKHILFAARKYGLEAKGFKMTPEALKSQGIFPCIVHWEFNHFIVVNGFKGNKFYINDPARGAVTLTFEEFDRGFTGICIITKPTAEFEKGGKPKSILDFAKERLKGTGVAIAFVILSTLIGSLIGILNSGLSRIFIDQLLTGLNPEWFTPFVAILCVVAAIQVVAVWIQTIYSLRINGKLAVIGNTTYLYKVLTLPMEFFSQRMAGDIQQRQTDNASIANEIVNTVAPLALNTIMMIFYFVVMIRYSPLLTVIGLMSVLGNMWISRIIAKKRINITRVMMRDQGNLSGTTVSGIELIETIKSSGAENGFFEKWSGYQASVNTQNVRFQKISAYLGMIPGLFSQISNIVVLIVGVYLCIKGSFTVGMVFAFQGFMSSFISPASSLISATQIIQEMRSKMERIEDVMTYPTDPFIAADEERKKNEPVSDISEKTFDNLSGAVSIKNLTFGYSKLAEPVIKDFNMELKPGSSVAFIGSSGCGKSTLSKLISGLYEPWSGEITFDGKSIKELDRSSFTGSVAVVDQDIIMFEDTIANNIKMWDNSIPDFEMIMAARDAQIHEDIMEREGGYNYMVLEGGKDFSGGQRQRLEIARVLAQDPAIIIMDEATSALDAKTEYDVVNSIRERGITCIVVAHRLSTIRDCDEIVVLDHGVVAERGTHNELMQNDGLYKQLVSNE